MLIAHTETARLNPNIVTRVRERSGRSNFQSVTKPGLTTIVRLIHHCLCLSSGVQVCVHPMREFPPEDKCVGVIVCNPWLSPALTADLHKCGRTIKLPSPSSLPAAPTKLSPRLLRAATRIEKKKLLSSHWKLSYLISSPTRIEKEKTGLRRQPTISGSRIRSCFSYNFHVFLTFFS